LRSNHRAKPSKTQHNKETREEGVPSKREEDQELFYKDRTIELSTEKFRRNCRQRGEEREEKRRERRNY